MISTRTTTHLVSVAVLGGVAAWVLLSPLREYGQPGQEATFALGFILLFAHYLSRILRGARMPLITSYILAGLIAGPHLWGLLSDRVVADLQALDDVALAIIALVAGGEMRMSTVRARAKEMGSVIIFQILFCFLGAMALVFLARTSLPFLEGGGWARVAAAGLILGLITAARSPATTIGVITELRAAGPVTELIMGITVILDVVVLVFVAVLLPTAEALADPSVSFSLGFTGHLFWELFGSAVAGGLFAVVLGTTVRWVGGSLPLFLVVVGLVGSKLCRQYGLEPLLAFMVAGFLVENFTELGDRLIRALERSAFPIYVVFFALSGASIDLDALRSMFLVALGLVVARALFLHAGVVTAARFVPALRPKAHHLWMAFLPQAGVTIGIAGLVARRFDWGSGLATLVLAVVGLNQLVGPVLIKWLLEREGEAGRMDLSTSSGADGRR
jgi:Kef-type K+ transport system membrane component KefB